MPGDNLWDIAAKDRGVPLVDLFFFLFGIFLHLFFVLERVVVVVDAHDAIERIGEGPIEGRSKPRLLRLECIDGRADLEIARAAASDCDGQLALFHYLAKTVAFGNITYFQVIFDVALQYVPALLANRTHDGLFGEDESAFAA